MAFGRIEDANALVGVVGVARGHVQEVNLFVGYTPSPAHGQVHDISVFVSYVPPPFLLVGHQSGADAIEDLPNSGESSPFHSNRDAARGIK